MKKILLLFVLIALAVSAFSVDSKSIAYKSGDETVQGVLYTPQGKGPFPALIVIHEWWGLNDWVKEQASQFADQGYVALAVDLYRGKVAKTPDEAHEILRGVRKDRIGAIGWCMGGGCALDAALQEPRLGADVINYGHLATDPDALKKINAPILGLFGAQDRGIPPADVRKFGQTLDQMGKKIDIKIHDDAGHAFENPNNKDGYREADATDARQLTLDFLEMTLKKP